MDYNLFISDNQKAPTKAIRLYLSENSLKNEFLIKQSIQIRKNEVELYDNIFDIFGRMSYFG